MSFAASCKVRYNTYLWLYCYYVSDCSWRCAKYQNPALLVL